MNAELEHDPTPPRRVLLCMWEGGGTVPPEIGLGARLVERGHTVHVLGDPTIESEAVAAGCTFHSWVEAPYCTARSPEAALVRDWEYKNPMKALHKYIDEFLCGPAPRYARDTLSVIDDIDADVVLCDVVMIGSSMAAEARGLPRIGLMPNIYILPTKGIPPMGPGFMPARTVFGHTRDAVMRFASTKAFNSGTGLVNQARSEIGLGPVESTIDQFLNVDRLAVMTSPSFDFETEHLPRHVRYVGPILDDPSWSTAASAVEWEAPWPVENTDPLVLVALSSSFQDQGEVIRRIVDALTTLPVRGLVTLGEQLDPATFESRANVVVVRAAPHTKVLQHAAAVVTHCGHGSAMKSLVAGVPLLCMPMGRDQNDTAARVVARGAGKRLKCSDPPPKIAAALTELLSDESYRHAAGALGARIQGELSERDPADRVLDLLWECELTTHQAI